MQMQHNLNRISIKCDIERNFEDELWRVAKAHYPGALPAIKLRLTLGAAGQQAPNSHSHRATI